MRRPLPNLPRGPRAPRKPTTANQLLAVPRVSPDWELGALRALMKPQEHEAIRHRVAGQVWPADAAERLTAARRLSVERLGYDPQPQLVGGGDYFLVATVAAADLPRATAFAVVLSRAFPGVWLVLGRLYLRDGRFFRRKRGYKLELAPAADIHLAKELRSAIGPGRRVAGGAEGAKRTGPRRA